MNLQQLRRAIIAMRLIDGADTLEGHRCSDLEQQIKNLATATGGHRARLKKMIAVGISRRSAALDATEPGRAL